METQARRTSGATPSPRRRAAASPDGSAPAPRPDRKLAILLAAERLFATRGYHAVSIRQIADEAGVPLALVGYYYGQKHELFHAIFARWAYTIDERIAALRAAEQLPHDADKLRMIVHAFIDPVLRLRASAEGEYYALLITVGLSMQQDLGVQDVIRDFFDPMARAFTDVLYDTVRADAPGATHATMAWCYQFALGALLHHISDIRVDRLSGGVNRPNDPAAQPLLVDFIVHGIRGVVSQHCSAPRKTRRRPA
ncbi:MAG: TetR family transcriptional regulator [Burkholderiaceae bacterium]|nr:TetR family transcriptional regulator [Burkholderiaceae bacterium]